MRSDFISVIAYPNGSINGEFFYTLNFYRDGIDVSRKYITVYTVEDLWQWLALLRTHKFVQMYTDFNRYSTTTVYKKEI